MLVTIMSGIITVLGALVCVAIVGFCGIVIAGGLLGW